MAAADVMRLRWTLLNQMMDMVITSLVLVILVSSSRSMMSVSKISGTTQNTSNLALAMLRNRFMRRQQQCCIQEHHFHTTPKIRNMQKNTPSSLQQHQKSGCKVPTYQIDEAFKSKHKYPHLQRKWFNLLQIYATFWSFWICGRPSCLDASSTLHTLP